MNIEGEVLKRCECGSKEQIWTKIGRVYWIVCPCGKRKCGFTLKEAVKRWNMGVA